MATKDVAERTAHTPGPWRVMDHLTAGPTIVIDREQKHIADCDFSWWPKEQNAANARLIAAAPELLTALRELTDTLTAIREDGISTHFRFGDTEAERKNRIQQLLGFIEANGEKLDGLLDAAAAAIAGATESPTS